MIDHSSRPSMPRCVITILRCILVNFQIHQQRQTSFDKDDPIPGIFVPRISARLSGQGTHSCIGVDCLHGRSENASSMPLMSSRILELQPESRRSPCSVHTREDTQC
jgi:hypothetical protein